MSAGGVGVMRWVLVRRGSYSAIAIGTREALGEVVRCGGVADWCVVSIQAG